MRIEELEYLTEEDVRRIRLVAQALEWEHEFVVRTPFTEIIRALSLKVIDKNQEIKMKALIEEEDKKKIKYYENHIVAMQNIKKIDKEVKRGLFNELVDVKKELHQTKNIVESINKFIEEQTNPHSLRVKVND